MRKYHSNASLKATAAKASNSFLCCAALFALTNMSSLAPMSHTHETEHKSLENDSELNESWHLFATTTALHTDLKFFIKIDTLLNHFLNIVCPILA